MTNKQAAYDLLNDDNATTIERRGALMMIAGWGQHADDLETINQHKEQDND